MKHEKIIIADNTIHGDWHHSTQLKNLLVICHGLNDSKKNPTIMAIAKGLNDKGHDTFTFNFSENTGGFDIEHQVNDIDKITQHFKAYSSVTLVAASFAALPAAIAATKIPYIKKLITVNGFFGQSELGRDHLKAYRKFKIASKIIPKYWRIHRYYKTNLKPETIKIPVLVIHTKHDQYVYFKQSQDFFSKLICAKEFVELQHAVHGITSPKDRQLVVSKIDKWLKH